MDRFGLIGHHISHSRSPELFREAYGGLWEYDLIDEESFDRAWDRFISGPYRGVNVTAPFKEQALARAGFASRDAGNVGAANILLKTGRGIEAHNSDYLGIRKFILDEKIAGKALVVGYGGAGKAAAAAAMDCGMDVTICNRDISKAPGIRPLGELKTLASDSAIVFHCLPCHIPETDGICCKCLFEANYRSPSLQDEPGIGRYVGGGTWLRLQAVTGFEILTGIKTGFSDIFATLPVE